MFCLLIICFCFINYWDNELMKRVYEIILRLLVAMFIGGLLDMKENINKTGRT